MIGSWELKITNRCWLVAVPRQMNQRGLKRFMKPPDCFIDWEKTRKTSLLYLEKIESFINLTCFITVGMNSPS